MRIVVAMGLAAAFGACGTADTSGGAGGSGGAAPIEGPATWSAIYADYFAPSAAGSCGGSTSGCHSTSSDAGVVVSSLICTDADECFATLTGASKLVSLADVSSPPDTKLLRFLRTPGGTGKMPKGSPFEFQEGDIARIEQWIANGAKKD